MGIFSGPRSAQRFLSEEENRRIVEAIRKAEMHTSGEIRIFVETQCPFVNAIDRAEEIFFGLKMEMTDNRNGVLVYIAINDHQLAIFADKGIFEAVGLAYWEKEVGHMLAYFRQMEFAEGLLHAVEHIGEALHSHFPYDRTTDKNELPDEIVFGH